MLNNCFLSINAKCNLNCVTLIYPPHFEDFSVENFNLIAEG